MSASAGAAACSSEPRSRAPGSLAWIVAVVVLVLGLSLVDPVANAGAEVRTATSLALVELGRLAGVRGADTEPMGSPLPVDVVQQGGELWVGQAVASAVEADPAFTRGDGPHLIQVEVVATPPVYAVRLGLWRRGWSLGPPRPVVARAAAWIAWLAAAVGALAYARGLAAGPALAATGALAQAGTSSLPWPGPSAAPALSEQWTEGPMGAALRLLAERLPDATTAVGIGVIVGCIVLAAFDHRRSRGRGGWLLVTGVVGAIGVVAWIEAAARVGVLGSMAQVAGWIAALGACGLWWAARGVRHRAHA